MGKMEGDEDEGSVPPVYVEADDVEEGGADGVKHLTRGS